jgi:hypothetical protein
MKVLLFLRRYVDCVRGYAVTEVQKATFLLFQEYQKEEETVMTLSSGTVKIMAQNVVYTG